MSTRGTISPSASLNSSSGGIPFAASQTLTVPSVVGSNLASRRASLVTGSPHRSRQGGLRRYRLSQWKINPLKDSFLTPLEKLRRILRSIRIIVEVCLALKKYVKRSETARQLTLVEMQLDLQADLNKKLTFNPNYYSASYVANKGSSKLKKLLAISPSARSKKHVKMINALVQNKNAFSKYPLNIRLKMCQVMIYQSYESRRVIIKQGHPPSAFYIILSGTCLINERVTSEDGNDLVQTINEIKDGDVFGEVALLNNTARTASVVCKDDVELLVIYREDFDAIVRKPIYKQREEVIEFCRNLDFLEDWPVEDLNDASFANFQYQYYRSGSVIVKHNLLSNFLVFVKSGECRVVCTLDGDDRPLVSTPSKGRTQSVVTKTLLPLLDKKSKTRATQQRSMSLAVHGSRQSRPLGRSLLDNADLSKPLVNNKVKVGMNRKRRLNPSENDRLLNSGEMMKEFRERKRQIMMQTLAMMGDDVTRAKRSSDVRRHQLGDGHVTRPFVLKPDSRMRSVRPSVMEDTPYTVTKRGHLLPLRSVTPHDPWRLTPGNSPSSDPPKVPKPKFAQIAVLKSGCVFGLEELMKRTQLQLSLLSDGAECILLSKKLFLKKAPPRTLRKGNHLVGRYPTEGYIRGQLEEQSDWSRFRREVVRDILGKREEMVSSVN